MISVADVRKTFKLYRRPADRLKEALFKRDYHKNFVALDKISFTVENGETLGIIGRNGAGKSTLLKLLIGVLLPDAGEIKVDGKITGLLELGTGFNPEFTGIKNIFLNAMYLGLSREEVETKLEEISSFCELGQYITEPLKTYSSGMVMRLAFATAIHANPDAFVIDEALSVGDAYFQQKCISRIKEFKDRGGSIIFVSHDLNAIKILCDRAILLERGRVIEEGSPEDVINAYNYCLSKQEEGEDNYCELDSGAGCYGNYTVEILDLQIVDRCGREIDVIVSGQEIRICYQLKARERVDGVTVGFLIRDKFGQDVYGTNTYHLNQRICLDEKVPEMVEILIKEFSLGAGKYTLTVAVHTMDTHIDECYHWIDNAKSFEVVQSGDNNFCGICDLRATAGEING